MTSQTAIKTQWPDYSEYGLYLLPRSHQNEYGFSEDDEPGRFLLLLDTKGCITEKTAEQANLRLLIKSEEHNLSLYVVLPYERKKGRFNYYGPSELLQKLELGYVARSRVAIPSQVAAEFKEALGAIQTKVKNILDFSTAIGVNHEGDTVFLSPYGRYLERVEVNEVGEKRISRLRASDVPLSLCLYAVDESGAVDERALLDCVEAFLYTSRHHAYDEKSAKQFAQLIFQPRPKDVAFKSSIDISESIIASLTKEARPLNLNEWQLFNNTILLSENIELYKQTTTHEAYQEFIYELRASQNNRHALNSELLQHSIFKPSIPSCISAVLGRILVSDDVSAGQVVYSPSIGNGSLLAGISLPLVFHANEADFNNYKLLKNFIERANELSKNQSEKPSYFATNKELALITPSSEFKLSISLLPAGPSPISTLLPFTDEHGGRLLSLNTDLIDQVFMIETLLSRDPQGRSIFLGPVEKNQPIGVVGAGSVYILKYLQAYYHDVSVLDLDSSLFLQNGTPVACRLYIIGEAKKKPSSTVELNERVSHISEGFRIPVFRRFEQLIEFEQALRLITLSKRRPNIDPTVMYAEADSDSENLTPEELDYISLFYTLKPKLETDKKDSSNKESRTSKIPGYHDKEPVFVTHTGEVITPKKLASTNTDANTTVTTSAPKKQTDVSKKPEPVTPAIEDKPAIQSFGFLEQMRSRLERKQAESNQAESNEASSSTSDDSQVEANDEASNEVNLQASSNLEGSTEDSVEVGNEDSESLTDNIEDASETPESDSSDDAGENDSVDEDESKDNSDSQSESYDDASSDESDSTLEDETEDETEDYEYAEEESSDGLDDAYGMFAGASAEPELEEEFDIGDHEEPDWSDEDDTKYQTKPDRQVVSGDSDDEDFDKQYRDDSVEGVDPIENASSDSENADEDEADVEASDEGEDSDADDTDDTEADTEAGEDEDSEEDSESDDDESAESVDDDGDEDGPLEDDTADESQDDDESETQDDNEDDETATSEVDDTSSKSATTDDADDSSENDEDEDEDDEDEDDEDEDEYDHSAPLTPEDLEVGLKESFFGPRYIDDPKKYLLSRKPFNRNSKKPKPPTFTVDEKAPAILAHHSTELMNEAVAEHLASTSKVLSGSYLRGLPIVDTHAPALLISNGIDVKSMQVLALNKYHGGADLRKAISEYEQKHGRACTIHALFSPVSRRHDKEIRNALEQIELIRNWVNDNTFGISCLYLLTNNDFSEYYALAKEYSESIFNSRKMEILERLRVLDSYGQARLMEYKARWWVNNDDVPTPPNPDRHFCINTEPKQSAGEAFYDVANSIITLSNSSVYSDDFGKGLRLISRYIAHESCANEIDKLASQLIKSKHLSFTAFVSMTSYAYALLYSGAHRFFKHNCKPEDVDEWLSKLYRHKDANLALLSDGNFLVRQAVDVDYARHLLANPLPEFETAELQKTKVRYISLASPRQSASTMSLQCLNDTHVALEELKTLWNKFNSGFDILSWFESSGSGSDNSKTSPIELVDMLFISISNLVFGRPVYICEGANGRLLPEYLTLLREICDYHGFEVSFFSTKAISKALLEAIPESIHLKPGLPKSGKGSAASNICNFVLCNAHELDDVIRNADSKTPTVYYITEEAGEYTSIKRKLVLRGQMFALSKPQPSIATIELPPTKKPDVLKKVYDHYAKTFDVARQLNLLASKLSSHLRTSILGEKLELCASSDAFGWWLAHQNTFLYGNPTKKLITERDEYITRLQSSGSLNYADSCALSAISQNKWLYLPDIKMCNTDAWLTALSEHLSASLQSPQVVTSCLDFINNGLQPIVLYDNNHDDLLHHILVSDHGESVPFTFIYELKAELLQLKTKLKLGSRNKNIADRIKLIESSLAGIIERRESEILSVFQQNKVFPRPLLEDAVHCYLMEVRKFYTQDALGAKEAISPEIVSEHLSDSREFKSFNQLLNTLTQYLNDSYLPKLPLSPMDTVANQISLHGYNVSMPKHRKYQLVPESDKPEAMWMLKTREVIVRSDVDMQIITPRDVTPPASTQDMSHPTRQGRLVMHYLPNNIEGLLQLKKCIQGLQPLISTASLIDVWTPTPLCDADDARDATFSDYLGDKPIDQITYLGAEARKAATQLLKGYVQWLPKAHLHKNGDAIHMLSLISQNPKQVQEIYLSGFLERIKLQKTMVDSKKAFANRTLPQSVFSRRAPAHKANDISVESSLEKILKEKGLPLSSVNIAIGKPDSIHDVYYKDFYKPIGLGDVLRLAARQAMAFKHDLKTLIDNHPHKQELINALSDHESNAEADYFLSCSENEKLAYMYKHLIRDMGYRGIKQRILTDLRGGAKGYEFNRHKAAISHKLSTTADEYTEIKELCLFIRQVAGDSDYIDQLQAQSLAKQMIDSYVDAICKMDNGGSSDLDLPVLCCRPKPELSASELSKNLPAISKMFSRDLCSHATDSSAYLGKNEWLITCGIKLPHYEQIIDLNSLVCYVASAGVDLGKNELGFETNARHLYNTYVDKLSLLVSTTHDVYQGGLTLRFNAMDDGFSVEQIGGYRGESFKNNSPISWKRLAKDLNAYQEAGGIGYEQVVVGQGEHADYCKNHPDLFESVTFNDVSGRLYLAYRMKEHAKSRYLNFHKLFSKIKPIKQSLVKMYFNRCERDKSRSITVHGYSKVLCGGVLLHIDNGGLVVSCSNLLLQDRLLASTKDWPKELCSFEQSHLYSSNKNLEVILERLGVSGLYTYYIEFEELHELVEEYAESLAKKLLNYSYYD